MVKFGVGKDVSRRHTGKFVELRNDAPPTSGVLSYECAITAEYIVARMFGNVITIEWLTSMTNFNG